MKFAYPPLSLSISIKVRLYILYGIYFIFNQNCYAQPGTLDKSFGLNGMVINEPGVKNASFQSITLQTDAKIIAAGYSTNGQHLVFLIARYDTNGNLDESFGTDGKVVTSIGPGSCSSRSVNMQSDGKLILAGYADNATNADFALARYNMDGSLDNSFGTGGTVITSFDSASVSFSSALQPDGKIVVAGCMGFSGSYGPGGSKFALVRYNPNGTLDNTFGLNGKVTTAIRETGDAALSVGIQSDGKIVLGGWSYRLVGYGNATDIAVVRYNTDGSLDATFGSGGKVITEVGMSSQANKLLILADYKIIICGCTWNGSNFDFALVRYNTEGSLDTTFGINGIVTNSIGTGNDYTSGILLQSDKKVLVSGSTSDAKDGSKSNFALARYNYNGSLDSTFGTGGIVVTAIDSNRSSYQTITLQTDGKILAAGSTRVNNLTEHSVLGRYISGLPSGIMNSNDSQISLQIFPNPAQQKMVLNYQLKNAGPVSIYLFNSLGQCKKIFLFNEMQQPCRQRLELKIPFEVTNGNYWIVLSSSDGTVSKPLIINNLKLE